MHKITNVILYNIVFIFYKKIGCSGNTNYGAETVAWWSSTQYNQKRVYWIRWARTMLWSLLHAD